MVAAQGVIGDLRPSFCFLIPERNKALRANHDSVRIICANHVYPNIMARFEQPWLWSIPVKGPNIPALSCYDNVSISESCRGALCSVRNLQFRKTLVTLSHKGGAKSAQEKEAAIP
jgi:hypothetical protein